MYQPTDQGCPVSLQTVHQFAVTTSAEPTTVWDALTDGGLTRRYLHGLAAHSTWSPGALLTLRSPGGGQLTGQVLRADPPRRLSSLLRSGPRDPATCLTWQLRLTPGGTTLRLQVDEMEGSSDDDAEDTWLPVLAALRALLEPAPPRPRQKPHTNDDQHRPVPTRTLPPFCSARYSCGVIANFTRSWLFCALCPAAPYLTEKGTYNKIILFV
jgi:uncharacterized protein YndB with AHSA1/START domain